MYLLSKRMFVLFNLVCSLEYTLTVALKSAVFMVLYAIIVFTYTLCV